MRLAIKRCSNLNTTNSMNRIITHCEGLHDGDLSMIGLQPKMDTCGIWTEGWGHAMIDWNGNFIKGIANKDLAYKLSKIHTNEEADKVLDQDLFGVNLLIARKITVPLSDNQKEAIQSFYFNCGFSETLTKLINTKSDQLYNWWVSHYIVDQNMVKQPGLVNRRKTEALLFTTGKLQFFS